MGAVRQAFALNLARHRERLGLTQAKLAEAIESSPSYVGHLERGEREPSLLTIEELAKALGIQAGEFFVTRANADHPRGTVVHELEELVRGRRDEDIELVIRLARAAFEDPRIASSGSESGGSAPAPRPRSTAGLRRAKKPARG